MNLIQISRAEQKTTRIHNHTVWSKYIYSKEILTWSIRGVEPKKMQKTISNNNLFLGEIIAKVMRQIEEGGSCLPEHKCVSRKHQQLLILAWQTNCTRETRHLSSDGTAPYPVFFLFFIQLMMPLLTLVLAWCVKAKCQPAGLAAERSWLSWQCCVLIPIFKLCFFLLLSPLCHDLWAIVVVWYECFI